MPPIERLPRPASPKSRPDPSGLRLAGGFAGLAAASAMVSAMLAPAPVDSGFAMAVATAPAQPEVIHVVRYVTLKPGQVAPPQAAVQQQPAPAPRTVVVKTRQSGTR
jgi:hypothetical protein